MSVTLTSLNATIPMTLGAGYEVNIHMDKTFVSELMKGTLTELTDLQIPSDITSIKNYLFMDNSNLTTVSLSNITYVGISAFASCGIIDLDLPNVMAAAFQAFAYNEDLESVCLPNLTQIANSMFRDSTSLKSADFPAATSIDRLAFYGCTLLDTLILRAETVCEWTDGQNLAGTKIADGEGYIYVPSDLVDSYKSATGWSTYADQILSIDELEVG